MKKTISRRDFLLLAGMSGAGVAAVCTCATVTTLILRERDADPLQPVVTFSIDAESPPIVTRTEWDALPPNHDAPQEYGMFSDTNPEGWRVYAGELSAVYKTLVLHHSVVYEANDLDTVREIQRTHREQRGWADIAYHYLIGKGGTIFEGRDVQVRGAHVGGYNTGSVGVCLLGNFMNETPTEAQIRAAYRVITWLAETLQLTHIAGHNQFNAGTVCPGDSLSPYLHDFAQRAGLIVGTGGYGA